MNILFIQTYTRAAVFTLPSPPLGLLYLASVAKQKSVNITLQRCEVTSPSSIEETVEKAKNADLCVMTLYTSQILFQYNLLTRIKHISPKSIILVGGPHASALPLKTMEECNAIDFLIYGEGEQAFYEFLQHSDPKKNNSLFYRKNGVITSNPPAPLLCLDDIQFPAHELFKPYYTYASVITSRGCHFDCEFCYKQIFGKEIRRRSPKNVVEELKLIVNDFNIKDIFFADDLFSLDGPWLKEFFSLIQKEHLIFNWTCAIDIPSFTEEKCEIFLKHGCNGVYLGIESADENILRRIGRRHTLKQVNFAIETLKKRRIIVRSFYIIGHRYDTDNSIRETINYSLQNKVAYNTFYLMMPFPGSKSYEYLNSQDKYNWNFFQLNDRRYLLPPSICQIPSRILKKYWEKAVARHYGSMSFIKEALRYKEIPLKLILTRFFSGLMARILKIRLKNIYDF